MFFMRTDSSTALLNEIIRLGLVTCTKCENDQWVPVTDRATLYMAVINELIADAEREGVNVVDGCYDKIEAIRCVEADDEDDDDSTPCNQLGGGCTCEDCTQVIIDAVGLDPDHEFEDDCERV